MNLWVMNPGKISWMTLLHNDCQLRSLGGFSLWMTALKGFTHLSGFLEDDWQAGTTPPAPRCWGLPHRAWWSQGGQTSNMAA